MQKKIIVLAIAAALAAPSAFAETTVYGKLSADFEAVKNSSYFRSYGSSYRVNRIASNASRFGVKGSEDLGDGLKAIYQIEVRWNVNGNEAGGGGGVFNGTRNSNVGLQGDFGTVFLGIWDTPYKVSAQQG